MLILGIIIAVLTSIDIYLITRTPTQENTLLRGQQNPTLHWQSLQDLDNENIFAPWEDILDSKLVEPKELTRYLQSETYTTQGEYDQSLDSYVRKEYPIIDLVFIHWRSPQESWDHLAGREGYVVISKTEKKQVDFIITVLS